MGVLPEFRDHMSEFIDYYACLGPRKEEDGAAGDGEDYQNRKPLKSAKMMRGQRRYFLDLKENSRGRYLRVRAPGQNYSDMPQQQIVLPARGIYVRMTEQSQNYRSSITVPEEQFRAIGEWFLNAASSIENGSAHPQKQELNSRRRSRDDDDYSD